MQVGHWSCGVRNRQRHRSGNPGLGGFGDVAGSWETHEHAAWGLLTLLNVQSKLALCLPFTVLPRCLAWTRCIRTRLSFRCLLNMKRPPRAQPVPPPPSPPLRHQPERTSSSTRLVRYRLRRLSRCQMRCVSFLLGLSPSSDLLLSRLQAPHRDHCPTYSPSPLHHALSSGLRWHLAPLAYMMLLTTSLPPCPEPTSLRSPRPFPASPGATFTLC